MTPGRSEDKGQYLRRYSIENTTATKRELCETMAVT